MLALFNQGIKTLDLSFPIVMHWDGNFETYHPFISHLQIKLSDAQHHNIVFGTDEEAAVIKAITACFPHLRKNYTQPIVSEILSKIVDAGGLLNAKGLNSPVFFAL
jgi:hypothetical protein